MPVLVEAPEWAEVVTAAERPEAWVAIEADDRFRTLWPEYNHHGDHSARYFGALFPAYSDLQVMVVRAGTDDVVARGRAIPFRWDGSLDDLPHGIDAVGSRALEERSAANALSALAAEVLPEHGRGGLSGVLVAAMAEVARSRGLRPLVAPVRPSWKHRYPITPIERYMRWQRADGLPFDPWMRAHARRGGSILRSAPHSMAFSHPVARWEQWVGMSFPEDGAYVFPDGLAPLTVKDGIGQYWEPNVWMLHHV